MLEKLRRLAEGGVLFFLLLTLYAVLSPSMTHGVSGKNEVYAGEPTCFDDVTTYGNGVVYCEADGVIVWPCGSQNPCPSVCPETTGPDVVGSPNKSVHESPNTNCTLGTDYDCISNDCIPEAQNIFCGTYTKPKNGCPS